MIDLTEAGREQLALALFLLYDHRTGNGMADHSKVRNLCLSIAKFCDAERELEEMNILNPPLRVVKEKREH